MHPRFFLKSLKIELPSAKRLFSTSNTSLLLVDLSVGIHSE